jgi:hypothetical protein
MSMASGPTNKPFWTAGRTGRWLAVLVGGALLLYVLHAFLFPAAREQDPDDFRPVRHILPQEPVVDFPVRTVEEADDVLGPNERVLGVTIGKESRAYPVDMLSAKPARKILNDTLGGRAIAATW